MSAYAEHTHVFLLFAFNFSHAFVNALTGGCVYIMPKLVNPYTHVELAVAETLIGEKCI